MRAEQFSPHFFCLPDFLPQFLRSYQLFKIRDNLCVFSRRLTNVKSENLLFQRAVLTVENPEKSCAENFVLRDHRNDILIQGIGFKLGKYCGKLSLQLFYFLNKGLSLLAWFVPFRVK